MTDTEFASNLPLTGLPGGVEPTNAADLYRFQDFTAPHGSSFSVHVRNVISVSAEEQVIGTDTSGIIASVANEQAYRDRPIGQFPCKTMRSNDLMVYLQFAVPMVSQASVIPAVITLDDIPPEAFLDRSKPSCIGTGSATETSAAAFDHRSLRLKLFGAMDAYRCGAWPSHAESVA